MKKKYSYVAALVWLAAAQPVPTEAQFFKQLLNTVKQTSQNRANGKADQATNKTIDKVDTSGNSLLGVFSRSAASNPGDTSAADLTMKALGIFVGGGGVSAADSAAALQSFKTANGGSGMCYQYRTLITSKKNPPAADTSYTWMTNGGEGRKEMRILMPGITSGKIISIGHAGQPKYSVQLYPDSKTYGLTIIDTSLVNLVKESFQVTKVGTEMVQGYSCIHVKMTTNSGPAMFRTKTTQDLWVSTAVPGYALYKKLTSVNAIRPQMMQALDQAGASGFIVKMETADKDYSMTMSLLNAQEKTFPAALFEIPEIGRAHV